MLLYEYPNPIYFKFRIQEKSGLPAANHKVGFVGAWY